MSDVEVKFRVGQLVKHRASGQRGFIYWIDDRDVKFGGNPKYCISYGFGEEKRTVEDQQVLEQTS